MIYIELFLTFFIIGMFTIGGGYAMLSLIQNEVVTVHGWIDDTTFTDIVAISQMTPGPIGINSATYIGYEVLAKAGASEFMSILGSFTATFAVVLPSFIIIYVISLFLDTFLTFTVVANAFRGIQACVVYLIGSVGIKMFKQLEKKPMPITIMSVVLACMIAFSLFAIKFSSIVYILVSGAIGVIAFYTKKSGKENDV